MVDGLEALAALVGQDAPGLSASTDPRATLLGAQDCEHPEQDAEEPAHLNWLLVGLTGTSDR
jgi:hypothetical protein